MWECQKCRREQLNLVQEKCTANTLEMHSKGNAPGEECWTPQEASESAAACQTAGILGMHGNHVGLATSLRVPSARWVVKECGLPNGETKVNSDLSLKMTQLYRSIVTGEKQWTQRNVDKSWRQEIYLYIQGQRRKHGEAYFGTSGVWEEVRGTLTMEAIEWYGSGKSI